MKQKHVFPYIYQHLTELVNGYVELPELTNYIVAPQLGDDAGITGALLLAYEALQQN